MANWSNPLLTSTYATFLSELKDRDLDVAKQFDGVTITNPVSGMIRWNSTNKYWEKYNGTAWTALSTKYSIDVETVDGCTVNDSSAASSSVLWTSDKISTFANDFYTKAQIDALRANYVVKNGENGTLTLGTNDASAVNLETNNTARLSVGGAGNVTISAPTAGVALNVTPLSGQDAISTTGQITASALKSTVATGTSPFSVTSTTKVTNLNADYLDGYSATNANTGDTIVQRDSNGNFSAGTVTATLSGNATTATTLITGRTINGTSFNGSANITTDNWGTARTINGVSVNGSTNYTLEPYVERDDSTDASRYIAFVDSSTAGHQRLNMDTDLAYNPSTNTLSANITGNLSGTATTATTATYATNANSAVTAGTATTVLNVPASTSTAFGGLKASLSGTTLTLSNI